MTQIFADSGRVIPVTRVQAGPCTVTQVVKEPHGTAVEVGYGEKKHLSKPATGHLKGLSALRFLRRFRIDAASETITRGAVLTVDMFKPGDRVRVPGVSKGKGFQGVVKRHHFAGGPASHGHKDNLRMPGSIGATGPQRVFKGKRMAGHMGSEQVTVTNLEIVAVDPATNELLIKGAIPGPTGSFVIIKGEGDLTVKPVETVTPAEAEHIEHVEAEQVAA